MKQLNNQPSPDVGRFWNTAGQVHYQSQLRAQVSSPYSNVRIRAGLNQENVRCSERNAEGNLMGKLKNYMAIKL